MFNAIFSDIGRSDINEMRKDLEDYNDFTAPAVEMHCLYGNNQNGVVEKYDLI